ncbi:hypothetical protein PENTCL1PPCAC_26272, partial [Pristionchus entomophagus]
GNRGSADHRAHSGHFPAASGHLHPWLRLQYPRRSQHHSLLLLLRSRHYPCPLVLLLPWMNLISSRFDCLTFTSRISYLSKSDKL